MDQRTDPRTTPASDSLPPKYPKQYPKQSLDMIILRDKDGEVLCAGEIVDTRTDDDGHVLEVVEFELRLSMTIRRPDAKFSSASRDMILQYIIGGGLAHEMERFSKGSGACGTRWAAVTE